MKRGFVKLYQRCFIKPTSNYELTMVFERNTADGPYQGLKIGLFPSLSDFKSSGASGYVVNPVAKWHRVWAMQIGNFWWGNPVVQ